MEAVEKRYREGVAALDGVSLRVARGEWVCVMGPSGSGKTTLLNLLAGLDRPTAGGVRVAGVALDSLDGPGLARHRRETVGILFQQFHLVGHLTAVENVMLAQHFHSVADEAEALEALARVGLRERAHHLPSRLSAGEQQRVCTARALINAPRLLLADEPTGSLDEASKAVVLDLLAGLHAAGQTLVVVTHDPSIGARADRCVRLEHGRLA